MIDIDTDIAVKERDKVGRPCKYETHIEPYLDKIFEWLKEGYTDYSIADNLSISQISWIRYKDKYDNLAILYTRAIHERNCLIMNSMYRKANGEKASVLKQKLDKDGTIHDLIEQVYIPADVNAADLYLRNHMQDYKSAKTDLSSGNITINNYQLDDLQTKREQLLREYQKLELQAAVSVECIAVDE